MHGVSAGLQGLILRLLRSRTQPRGLGSCYKGTVWRKTGIKKGSSKEPLGRSPPSGWDVRG